MNITCAKEIWDYREVTYERTNEIKNNKINILSQEFEYIGLLPNETIDDFLNRFKASLTIFDDLEEKSLTMK